MVKLIIKNLKGVEEAARTLAEELIKSKVEFYENLVTTQRGKIK